MLTGCSATPAPDQTYKSVSKLAKTFENTTFASENGYTCTVDDRRGRQISVDENGHESAECTSDEAGKEHFGLIVAKTPRGEVWMDDYPLLDAMPSERGVLKGPEHNWQITGPIDLIREVQDELGGKLYLGSGPNV